MEEKKKKKQRVEYAIQLTPENNSGLNFLFKNHPKLFLGGTIANGKAPNWQADMVKSLFDLPIYILNPRCAVWNPDADTDAKNNQIEWEIKAQDNSDVILYYFDPDYPNPITLHELGKLFSVFDKKLTTHKVCMRDQLL